MKHNFKLSGSILLLAAFISVARCTGHPSFAFDSGRFLSHTAIELVLNELPQYDIPQISLLSNTESTGQVTNIPVDQPVYQLTTFSCHNIVQLSLLHKKPLINYLHSRFTKTIYFNSSYL
jgi:hypothetical protein